MDLFGMFGKLNQLKEAVSEVQEKLGEKELISSSSDGKVHIVLSGQREVKDIDIHPDLLNPEAKEELQDQLTICFTHALEECDRLKKELMKEKTGGILPSIPGLDLSSFGL